MRTGPGGPVFFYVTNYMFNSLFLWSNRDKSNMRHKIRYGVPVGTGMGASAQRSATPCRGKTYHDSFSFIFSF